MDANARIAHLRDAYRRFNAREVSELLAMMTDDIEWPNVAGGTVLRGHDQVRAYWEAQFAVADPQVEPIDFTVVGDDVLAEVDQRVLDLDGTVLVEPATVWHRYSFAGDLVCAMVVHTNAAEATAATP